MEEWAPNFVKLELPCPLPLPSKADVALAALEERPKKKVKVEPKPVTDEVATVHPPERRHSEPVPQPLQTVALAPPPVNPGQLWLCNDSLPALAVAEPSESDEELLKAAAVVEDKLAAERKANGNEACVTPPGQLKTRAVL